MMTSTMYIACDCARGLTGSDAETSGKCGNQFTKLKFLLHIILYVSTKV